MTTGTIRRAGLVALFLLGLFTLDRVGGAVHDRLFARSRTGMTAGLVNHVLEQDAAVFVFGSSRARHHVDPKVLSERFGCTVFNAGANGQSAYYAWALQSLLLEQGRRPELLILQVAPKDLHDPRIDRLSLFAPYYGKNPRVDDLLTRGDRFATLKLSSHLYRYNSRALAVARAGLIPGEPDADGFVPLKGQLDAELAAALPPRSLAANGGADPVLEPYRGFAEAARELGIPVVWFIGPRWRGDVAPSEYERKLEDVVRALAAETGGDFLEVDERALPVFQDIRWYRDRGHLHAEGAALFTTHLADAIAASPIAGAAETDRCRFR